MLALIFFSALFLAYIQVFVGDNYVYRIKQGAQPTFFLLLQSLLSAPNQRKGVIKEWVIYSFLFALGLAAAAFYLSKTSLFSMFFFFIWLCALSLLAKIDFHTQLLPNALTYPLWLIGVVLQIYSATTPWASFILPSLLFYSLGWLVSILSRKLLHYPVIGLGDIKLLTAVFCWWGGYFMLMSLLLACLLFLIAQPFKTMAPKLQPFGHFIVFGVFSCNFLIPPDL